MSLCLSLSVCVSVCVTRSEAIFFVGVVVMGIFGWRVRVLVRGGGGITTDPVEFPCHADAFPMRRASGVLFTRFC